MRGWGAWSEGWEIITGDPSVPVWTNEEGAIDKAIRIASIWVLFIIITIILGILKVAL